jgi:hypothetical protein
LAFFPSGASPFATFPLSLRSICQSAVSPPFFNVNAKIALPFLIASFRSPSSCNAEERTSKADEEGKRSNLNYQLDAFIIWGMFPNLPSLSDMMLQCVIEGGGELLV